MVAISDSQDNFPHCIIAGIASTCLCFVFKRAERKHLEVVDALIEIRQPEGEIDRDFPLFC